MRKVVTKNVVFGDFYSGEEIDLFFKVCHEVYSQLEADRSDYSQVFKLCVKMDYFTTVYDIIARKLSSDANMKMMKAATILSSNPTEECMLRPLLFFLYFCLRGTFKLIVSSVFKTYI